MGSRLDGFDIQLEFNADGSVGSIYYEDAEGCGKRIRVDPSYTLYEVVGTHLNHYGSSHKMEPPKYCSFTLPSPGNPELEYHCTLQPHDSDMHELKARKIRQ